MLYDRRGLEDVWNRANAVGGCMKVLWSSRASISLQRTSAYIEAKFGYLAKQRFLLRIHLTSELMEDNPYMGSVEPLLSGDPRGFRSIVVGKINKLVYYVKGDVIRISDLWDTRREPKGQAKETAK